MSEMGLSIKEILKMIKDDQISSKEGLELIKELKKGHREATGETGEWNAASYAEKDAEPAKIPFKDAAGADSIKAQFLDIMSNIMHISPEEIDTGLSFKDMGVDSISGVEIVRDVNKAFDLNLDAVILYDFSNVNGLSQHIMDQIRKNVKVTEKEDIRSTESTVVLKSPTVRLGSEAAERYKEELLMKNLPSHAAAASSSVQSARTEAPALKPLKTVRYVQEVQAVNTGTGRKISLKEKNRPNVYETAAQAFTSGGGAPGKMSLNPLNKEPAASVGNLQQQTEPPATSTAHLDKKIYINRSEDTAYLDKMSGNSLDIAVIGMSCRYAQADNLAQFWDNAVNCRNCIIEVPKERWDISKCYDPDPKAPNKTYSRWMGMVNNVDRFDPLFFNISPMEAELMDPQQRIFLQEAWNALEGAGYSDKSLDSVKCGVFVGAAYGDYEKHLNFNTIKDTGETFAGLSTSILSGRISYLLNLKGPSISLDTACSSSLVAIHEACQSILFGESDMAVAGGVRLMLTPGLHIQSCKAGMLSPTGNCRAFDNDADGIVLGEGVGVIVMKPLKKALADRDYIYGVIKGSGSNQDGKTNGISAPSAQSQAKLEFDVYKRFGINPETITMIETHGTGTKLGDPIEVKALKEAFGHYTKKKNFCALGSVKANIGHTTMAAGVAGIIRALLAFKHKKIPGLVNFKNINEHIELENSPFYITDKTIDWITPGNMPRRAAVSGFGFSGTNCHIVLEEAPER